MTSVEESTGLCTEVVNSYDFVYYNAKWQEPVITEKCVFDLFYEGKNIPHHYFAFPWATYIDNKWKKDRSLNDLLDSYTPDPSKTYFTVFQHYRFREHIDVLKRLRIQYLFTPHCAVGDEVYESRDGIKVLPFPLYPAQRSPADQIRDIRTRPLLASFIGQYNPKNYLTDVRVRLIEAFSQHADCYVLQRTEWHYQAIVYRGAVDTNLEAEEVYKRTLCDSKFSLCPSGCGPNSIRIWESLQCGSIPVILADTMVMPPCGRSWEDCCIVWKEGEVGSLYEHLKNFEEERLAAMSLAGMDVYAKYFSETTMNRGILDYFKS